MLNNQEKTYTAVYMVDSDWNTIDPMSPTRLTRSSSQETNEDGSITPQSSQSWLRPESEEAPRQSETIPVPNLDNDQDLDEIPHRTRFQLEEPDQNNNRENCRKLNCPSLSSFHELFRQAQGLQQTLR